MSILFYTNNTIEIPHFLFYLTDPNIDSDRASTLSTRMSHQIRLEDDVYERIKTNKTRGVTVR